MPLHTCSNYNGQKTNQHGIHGFWESRIPELFADENYDYFVGKPKYIEKTDKWFWNTAFASNELVDSVLSLERALRRSFPSDRQMCPDMRNRVSSSLPRVCRSLPKRHEWHGGTSDARSHPRSEQRLVHGWTRASPTFPKWMSPPSAKKNWRKSSNGRSLLKMEKYWAGRKIIDRLRLNAVLFFLTE